MIDLTFSYQQDVARIKASNPRSLWPKLIDEYYSQKISNLTQPFPLGEFGLSAMAMTGDPAQSLRAVLYLLPLSSKWMISEVRNQTNWSPIYDTYRQTSVFVTIDYALDESTPMVEKNFLKQTILKVSIHAATKLAMSVSTVDNANVFWTKPYPKTAANVLLSKYKADIAKGDRDAVRELIDLIGWPAVENYLMEIVKESQRSPGFDIAVEFLAERHVQQAIPFIVRSLAVSRS